MVPEDKKLQSSRTKPGKYLPHYLARMVFHVENVSHLYTGLLIFLFLTTNCCKFESITLDKLSCVHVLCSFANVRTFDLLRRVRLGFQTDLYDLRQVESQTIQNCSM